MIDVAKKHAIHLVISLFQQIQNLRLNLIIEDQSGSHTSPFR